MAPILGIFASKYTPLGDFESIATVSVTAAGGATDVTFSSIPSTYKHLQVRYISRQSGSGQYFTVQFNSDTSTASYTWHSLQGDGATATGAGAATGTFPGAVVNYAGGSGSSYYSAGIFDVLDYANSNKYKTVRSLNGYDANGSGVVNLQSNLWLSTATISSIKFLYNGSASIAQYSHFALYGIKG